MRFGNLAISLYVLTKYAIVCMPRIHYLGIILAKDSLQAAQSMKKENNTKHIFVLLKHQYLFKTPQKLRLRIIICILYME